MEAVPADPAELAESLLRDDARRRLHVQSVGLLAEKSFGTDKDLDSVVAAAWLHDIGYASELRVTGFHPLDGANYLRGQGFDEEIVTLVAHHTGAMFEAEERGLEGYLLDFPMPPDDQLDALNYLDLSTGPDGSRLKPHDRVTEILSRYPEENAVHRAVTRSRATLIYSASRGKAIANRCTGARRS
ncbi:HDIG domain-containing metalloprotein [Naumannella halotolerans]|uniref:HDIG domain-containing metalloprotein n=1 Tax=Naumannella halotolerans TaxID=993414 RepID=UPI00370D3729